MIIYLTLLAELDLSDLSLPLLDVHICYEKRRTGVRSDLSAIIYLKRLFESENRSLKTH